MSNVLVNFLPPVHPKPNAAFATQYDDYRYQADTVYVTFLHYFLQWQYLYSHLLILAGAKMARTLQQVISREFY